MVRKLSTAEKQLPLNLSNNSSWMDACLKTISVALLNAMLGYGVWLGCWAYLRFCGPNEFFLMLVEAKNANTVVPE